MKTIDLRPLFATYLMFDAPYARHEMRLNQNKIYGFGKLMI